tara:strand:+ start:263 stop:526 length:264 start_codon:yes stop_codon:yes gene_type:complete
MELLYKNKFLVSVIIGCLIAVVFFNYNKINSDALEYTDNEVNNDNKNKDNSLYLFLVVSTVMFGILYFTEDNVDEVYNEIDVGEPPF